MGPDLELKGRPESVMESSGNKETVGVKRKQQDEYMKCVSNCEDSTFEIDGSMDEKIEEADKNQAVEINILEHTNSGDIGFVGAEYQDTTEDSSSFDDTVSGVEKGTALSDAEMESLLHDDASSALPFDGQSEIFQIRKKRLTPHWRTYIRPLMWRCKWVELQIKEFQSLAKKYDIKLAECQQRKRSELENCPLEDSCAKSHPFSGQSRGKEVMKRKKRKRVEDTVDIASYLSRHNLFSYYESMRSAADASMVEDDWSKRVISAEKTMNGNEMGGSEELLSLDFGDDNPMEQILLKIENVLTQIGEMKTRLQKITSKHGMLSPTDNLGLVASGNALTSSDQTPAFLHNNGDGMPGGSSYNATQFQPNYNRDDLVIPENEAPSHGQVNHVPDITESTDQPKVGSSSKITGDGGILMYNRRAKGKLSSAKEADIKPMEKPQVPKEDQDNSVRLSHPRDHDLPSDDQLPPKIRSISKITASKNKRKRGRRKAGSSRWNR
ncbi:uncharacterized protein LOC127813972 [Diospyros lotus]|uniref:uncharacterized protein LOC127813972 n=1 Tax=Diospyros lotus TaxID=55363 RepID=UPI0022578A2E|nr:uncharacterized protein LOC127813972 [Diospyros lotus]XP_052211113.1 uncharacterized protein LOC127813972 [Diospyros lotus]